MCVTNTRRNICGQTYAHLRQPGTRFEPGGECRAAIQDYIIQNRLTPNDTLRNFGHLLRDMHLKSNGEHIKALMTKKVRDLVRNKIREMIKGGLISEVVVKSNDKPKYLWRQDADNFLGQAPRRDWSLRASKLLARQKASQKSRASHKCKSSQRKPSSRRMPPLHASENKQTVQGTQVNGRNIGSHAIVNGSGGVNIGPHSFHIYHKGQSDDEDDETVVVYEESEDDDIGYSSEDSDEESDDDAFSIAKSEIEDEDDKKDIVMRDAPVPVRVSLDKAVVINNCNHACFRGCNHNCLESSPSESSPLDSPAPRTTSPPASSLIVSPARNHTPPPTPSPINLHRLSATVHRPDSIAPEDSVSVAHLSTPRRMHQTRTAINTEELRRHVSGFTEQELFQAVDHLAELLIEEATERARLSSVETEGLYAGTNQYLDYLDVLAKVIDDRSGLGVGEGILELSWWWVEL
ncbi:hypothetical protein ACHAPU_010122 [Fusarium lateritium]